MIRYDKNTKDFIRDLFRYFVGISIIVGFFLVLYKLVEAGEYKDAVISLISALSGSVVTIVAFEFGSSRSSQIKDENLKNQS